MWNGLQRHAMPVKKTMHSYFSLKKWTWNVHAFAHGSQSWHFLWGAQHCKQRGSINIPQLTFSVSSPSPGFSYLINQLSFPLSEEVKRDIRFPFQRLCKQLASLLCGHNMLSWKTLVGTFVWGVRQKVKMKKDNGKVCLKRDFITMVFWGEQSLPGYFFYFPRNHEVFFSQKIKKIPWQPLLSSKHHNNKIKNRYLFKIKCKQL